MQSLCKLFRHGGWSLVAVLLLFLAPSAHAGLLGPEAAMPAQAQSQSDADRAKVQQFLERANVKERLQAMGVAGLDARDRVDALSEEEVHVLAQRIDGLPAGGRLSETDIILILLIALLVAVVV
ncbi:MAG: PA2779 family protein [Ramlibacter sp.]